MQNTKHNKPQKTQNATQCKPQNTTKYKKKQAGAELGQAQAKLEVVD